MNVVHWITLLLAAGQLNADSEQLRAAARSHGVPGIVMEGIAAVESGYSGRNDVVGAAGEVGRMQIKEATARLAHCPDPIQLDDHAYNIDCGARILRWCRDRNPDWSAAIRCYQGIALPPSTTEYLRKVETEIGRQQLARLQ